MAGVSIFKQQLVPTLITVCVFSPVVVAHRDGGPSREGSSTTLSAERKPNAALKRPPLVIYTSRPTLVFSMRTS